MGHLSSIIAWISVDFSGPLPHAIGFVLGVLSLVNAIIMIIMIGGASRIRKILAFLLLITSAVTLLTSTVLFIMWITSFLNFCDNCLEPELTYSCVDACNDECCFRDISRPLALVFILFSALTVLCSLAGIGIAVSCIRFVNESNPSKKR